MMAQQESSEEHDFAMRGRDHWAGLTLCSWIFGRGVQGGKFLSGAISLIPTNPPKTWILLGSRSIRNTSKTTSCVATE